MKSIILTFICINLAFSTSIAQDDKQVIIDQEKKFQFTAPEGWKITKKDEGYLMGSPNTQGFMLIKMQKITSLKKLKSSMEAGVEQEDGSMLMPNGDLGMLGKKGVSGMYSGKIDGVEMTGFLMALMPPSNNRAAICIAVAPTKSFNQSNIDQLKILLRSVIFL